MRSLKAEGQNPSAPIRIKSHEKVNPQQNGFFIYQCEKRGLPSDIAAAISQTHPDLETFGDLLKLVEGSP